jgi:hypothetical protein
MAFIYHQFVDGEGCRQVLPDRMYVNARCDSRHIHLDAEGIGRGSVQLSGRSGTGEFTTRSSKLLRLTVDRRPDGRSYDFRLRHAVTGNLIAEGIITDIPPPT